jgi:uncharacterized damage-inducible protein DinB
MSDHPIDADDRLFVIGPHTGAQPQVEAMVSMLQTGRRYLLSASRGLGPEQLTAVPTGVVNSIGALLSHVSAGEKMFQNLLFRGFVFSDEEQASLAPAFRFEADPLAGSEVAAYHEQLAAVRADTLALFAEVDDAWLAYATTFAGRSSNRHYYWLHYLMDEARHCGQIILLRKRLIEGAEPDFDPFALR